MARTASFPHPVLGNHDDVNSVYEPHFEYQPGESFGLFLSNLTPSNQRIAELIAEQAAHHVIRIECSSTFYRRTFTSLDAAFHTEISETELRNKVTVLCRICAARAITGYLPSDAHPDYAGAAFTLRPGDVLAAAPQFAFIAEKDFDPLRPVFGSFIQVRRGESPEGPLKLEVEDENITVCLSHRDFEQYQTHRKTNSATVHAHIALPAVTEALRIIARDDAINNEVSSGALSEHSERLWYGRLKAILNSRQLLLNEDNTFEIGQELLSFPVYRSFEEIGRLTGDNE